MRSTFNNCFRVCQSHLNRNRYFVRGLSCTLGCHMSPTTPTTVPVSSKPLPQQQQQLGVPLRMRIDPAFMHICTPEFKSIFTEELRALIDIFKRHDYELRIAGGAVRDIVMGIQPKDIDLATIATPDQMKEMFTSEQVRMINAKGERHGTITPRINNKENFEVTTLRIDVRTDGRHAEVQFTTDWQLDANRRDLTINSMFLGFDGTLYDYFYGYDDLQARRVVFVGDADVRIKEDYLRILRYFRFYGRIAREPSRHDAATLQAIRQNADGLARISGERIWSELQKIVVGNFGCELMQEMIDCGLAKYCGLPEKLNIDEFKRVCADLTKYPQPHLSILYIIALLNTHEAAIHLHERLKLSAYERDLALFITQMRHKVDKEFSTIRDYQKLCLQPYTKREYVEELLKYSNKFDLYNVLKTWKTPHFPLNGNLLRDHGCPMGKKMGLIMSQLKLIWANSDFTLSADEMLKEHLPQVLEKFATTPPNTPTKKSRRSE